MRQLKIGLLLNSHLVHAYQAAFIRDLLKDLRFNVACLFFFRGSSTSSSVGASFKTAFWDVWSKRSLYPKMEALHTIDLAEAFSSCLQKDAQFTVNESSYVVDNNTLTFMNELQLDVIINCQDKSLSGPLLSIPRWGVWSLHLSIGFWETYYQQAVCSASLQRLTDDKSTAIILRKGHFKTDLLALAKTQDKVLFESSAWFKSCLSECWHDDNAIHQYVPIKANVRDEKKPNNIQMSWFLLKSVVRKWMKSLHQRFFFTAWNVAILPLPLEKLTSADIEKQAKWLPELPWPLFQADPFGVKIDEQRIVYFEEGNHQSSLGELKALMLSPTLEETARVNISTSSKCHHSYPYVFEDKGKRFVIPESLQAKQCMLYEIIDDKGTLKQHATLLDGLPVIDPSLLYFNDRYWLFCTLSSPYTDGNTSLYIFYADTLEGPYEPHLLNPVKSDIHCSRPAGAFFFKEGKLYRPAQDCSRVYGGAIAMLEIEKLTTTEFKEHVVDWIKPHSRYPEGLHSLSRLGKDHSLIDGKRFAFSIKKALSSLMPSKPAFSMDKLNALSPLHAETKLSNFNAISNHLLTSGIDSDCWCAKEVELFFRLPQDAIKLRLQIDFPGWQSLKYQGLTIRVNDKFLFKTSLRPGPGAIELPLQRSDTTIKISIAAKSKFRMPFPDTRYRAFQLCEIGFVA